MGILLIASDGAWDAVCGLRVPGLSLSREDDCSQNDGEGGAL